MKNVEDFWRIIINSQDAKLCEGKIIMLVHALFNLYFPWDHADALGNY